MARPHICILCTAAVFASVLSAEPAAVDPNLPSYQPARQLSGELRVSGSDSLDKWMKVVADSFKQHQPNLAVVPDMPAPTAALPLVLAGSVDIGAMARELFPYETEAFEKFRGYKPLVITVAGGSYKKLMYSPALAVYVNQNNPIERLTMAQLDAIYSPTRSRGYPTDIKTWGDLGLTGEWASRPIKPYSVVLPNGISYFFQYRVTNWADFKKSVIDVRTRGKLTAYEQMAKAAIDDPSVISYGTFSNLHPGMKTVALAEKEGGPYYTGTAEEVASFKYPLTRYIYFFVDRPPGKPLSPELKEFLQFMLSKQGQETIATEGSFLPLTSELARAELKKLD